MKIVHLGKFYPPDTGGIESVTQVLAQGHAGLGHDVAVGCFARNALVPAIMDGVMVHRFPMDLFWASQPVGWRYVREGLRMARAADVVHVHVPNLLASLMTLFVSKRPRVIVHWHSDVVNKGWFGKVVRPLERAMLRRADAVIATSPPYLNQSKLLQYVRDKVRVVPIGIPLPDSLGLRPALANTFDQFLSGRKLILSVGRLVPYKGFQHLVDAAAAMPDDAAVIIAGNGPLRSALQAQIDGAGVGRKILLAGRVSDEELSALLAHAHVFCLPSVERSEAFGVVLLEAMCRGIPLIATRIEGSGTSWVNQDGVSGLNVATGDAPALAVACSRILQDSQLHQLLSEGARQRFHATFSVARFIADTEKLYIETLAQRD
ncbi:glycosyltransferase [Stenotrophobium rhamnosiphilum]|uniref:Glycosyl transferase n=1 Tax=Stenotrophobium rhamnosiphilum TaxID=2029166 RepID=A0A2T5MIE0_9GAMM|nr:glycosyltransferase [Stenotrophobium rhamnosiphilum]PTU32363.1 glycosyl transferase [Stenotrophobium rhamnosiphilum]